MKNMKSTKRSLFLSAMALLLCTSMLIGTTYAWFTESVSSVNNIITGGNLDVELKWSADGSTWKDVDANTNVFTSSLWEPGHTEVVYLKVSNVGDLSLKYQLGVNVASETPAVNADGDQIWLSQYIKFGVVESGKVYAQGERAQAIADVQASAKLLKEGYSKSSTLYPTNTEKTTSETVALVVYMPETVGNEANYVGEVAPKINLGINLIATQFTWENDSFGNDYDEDAIYYDVLVSTVDELYAAVAAATGDIVIAVDGNLVLTKALSKSGLKSIKFVAWDDEATIDQATYNMHFNGAKVTFEGLNLTHGEKAYGNGGQTSTAFAVWDAKEVNYVDCTFARSVGTIHASLHNFIRCTFNGVENPGNTKSEYPLYICHGQDYNVIDCTFNCTNRGAILFYNDGGSGVDTLNISGTKFLGDIIDDKTAVEIHNNSTTQVYNVNIKNVIVGDGVIKGLYRIKPGNVGEVNVSVDGVTTVATASTGDALKDAISKAKAGDTIYLNTDVTVAGYAADKKLIVEEAVTIDLNGQTMTTECGWGGIDLKNGASIVNGTINHTGNTAAIKAFQVEKIENVVINVTETAGKTKGGIVVQSGESSIGSIKNVTIIGATNGIECNHSAGTLAIGSMENVKIDATANGIFLNGAGVIGKISNCEIKGGNIGINAYLANLWHISLNIENSKITGGTTGIDIWDEGQTNTGSTVTFNYDAESVFAGARENIKITLQEEITCTENGVAVATPCDVRK
ncbi:MAG: hypothetical protein J6M12_06595 [Clostridia bacterium]|nr:hypothetical protein [Clostridia bacterium]